MKSKFALAHKCECKYKIQKKKDKKKYLKKIIVFIEKVFYALLIFKVNNIIFFILHYHIIK